MIIVFRAKDIELKVKMNIELDDYSQTEAFEETELQESSKIELLKLPSILTESASIKSWLLL